MSIWVESDWYTKFIAAKEFLLHRTQKTKVCAENSRLVHVIDTTTAFHCDWLKAFRLCVDLCKEIFRSWKVRSMSGYLLKKKTKKKNIPTTPAFTIDTKQSISQNCTGPKCYILQSGIEATDDLLS